MFLDLFKKKNFLFRVHHCTIYLVNSGAAYSAEETINEIGSVRCIIIPIDGDCALGFRCIEFTSCSMADEQFASLICSQLKIGLAHRGAKTSGRECDLLQILYDS